MLSLIIKGDSEVTIDDGTRLTIDGSFQANKNAEFRGEIKVVDVTMTVEGDLTIDGKKVEMNILISNFERV